MTAAIASRARRKYFIAFGVFPSSLQKLELLVGSGREEGFTISIVRWFDIGGCDLGGRVFKENIALSMGRMSAGIGLSRGKAGYLTLGLIHQLGTIEEGALEAGGVLNIRAGS